MANKDDALSKVISRKQNRRSISIDQLVKEPNPEKLVGSTPQEGQAFLAMLRKKVDSDVTAVSFVHSPGDLPPPKRQAGVLVSDDHRKDRKRVSEYMKTVLTMKQGCPASDEVTRAAKDALKRAQERDAASETEETHSFLDQKLRIHMVVGRVQPHPQRDKDAAPDPFHKDAMITDVDHRGHLFAANLAADAELADVFVNVIPEHGSVNVGAKKRFENAVAKHISANPGEIIHTIHIPHYKGKSKRPYAVSHYVAINGVVVGSVTLPNPEK